MKTILVLMFVLAGFSVGADDVGVTTITVDAAPDAILVLELTNVVTMPEIPVNQIEDESWRTGHVKIPSPDTEPDSEPGRVTVSLGLVADEESQPEFTAIESGTKTTVSGGVTSLHEVVSVEFDRKANTDFRLELFTTWSDWRSFQAGELVYPTSILGQIVTWFVNKSVLTSNDVIFRVTTPVSAPPPT